jgi:uridine kinase
MNGNLIAIVGGSGSGKTWLSQRLAEEFGQDAGRLSLDDFYRDLSHLPPVERDRTNFDHPDAIDWPLFYRCVSGICRGQAVALPSYDFATHTRRPVAQAWQPRRVVLLEGLWLLRDLELRQLYRLSVFVDCPEHVRLKRRLARDLRERGRSARSVCAQFERQVAPMHHRFVTAQARHADLVLESPVSTTQLSELLARCNQRLHQAN